MTGPGFRFARAALVPGLLLGATSCAPLLDRPNPVEIRPVETPSADGISADESAYRSAARAIDDRDYALALENLQAAREREPLDVRVLNAFGVVYDKLGRFDLSARYYSEAKAIDPRSTIVVANIAYSRALQGLSKGEPATSSDSRSASEASSAIRQGAAPTAVQARIADSSRVTSGRLAAGASTVHPDFAARTPQSGDATARALPVATERTPHDTRGAEPKPTRVGQYRPDQITVARTPVALPVAPLQTSVPIAVATDSNGPAPARATARVPLLTGHPLSIVNASGRKGATDAMRRRLMHLGWTAPRWAARDGADARQTTLFYARPYAGVARALARTLRFSIHLASRSCGCGGLELVVGKDFLRGSAFADNLEPGRNDSGEAGGTADPTKSKEHDHVPAKA
jgi:hypothetical protein